MEILENYKNLFLNPRDFAVDKAAEAWPIWAYVLLYVLWQGIIIAASALMNPLGMMTLPISLVGIPLTFVSLWILNSILKPKDMPASEYWQVNLAYAAYILPPVAVCTIVQNYFILRAPLIVMLVGLIFAVAAIWMVVSFCKILSELHGVSAWKAFGAMMIVGIIIGLIQFALASAFIMPKL